MILLMCYARSPIRAFESCLRIIVGLNENDIQLILKQNISRFMTYEIPPGNYSIEDISEIVSTKSEREGTLQLEYVDISMKTKIVLNQFSGTFVMIGTMRFDEKSFFKTLLGFEPYWD